MDAERTDWKTKQLTFPLLAIFLRVRLWLSLLGRTFGRTFPLTATQSVANNPRFLVDFSAISSQSCIAVVTAQFFHTLLKHSRPHADRSPLSPGYRNRSLIRPAYDAVSAFQN